MLAKRVSQLTGHEVVVGFAEDVAFSRADETFELRIAGEIGAVNRFQPDQIGDGTH